MKKTVLFILCSFAVVSAFCQIKNPVSWAYAAKKLNATTFEVHLTATIDGGWHIYSQTTPDGGPVPTAIVYTKNPLITVTGKTKEIGKLEQHHEELFGIDVKQYSNKVDFVQTVTLKGKVKTAVTGTVEYMVCNDHECLPPSTQKFSIALN